LNRAKPVHFEPIGVERLPALCSMATKSSTTSRAGNRSISNSGDSNHRPKWLEGYDSTPEEQFF
jgi:hypothetical protein